MLRKDSEKIIVACRNLELAIRLGLTKDMLWSILTTAKIQMTGDPVFDDLLSRTFKYKNFQDKRGGNHNPTGKNQYSSNGGQSLVKDEVKPQTCFGQNEVKTQNKEYRIKNIENRNQKIDNNINNNIYDELGIEINDDNVSF